MTTKNYEYFSYEVDGLIIESKHPDKLYWPEAGVTKKDLMDYYNKIGDYMMPFLKERPLTLHFFPYGIHKFSFYKRDYDIKAPEEFIKTYLYEEATQDKVMRVPVVKNKAGLVYLASRGCLEIHAWGSTYPDFELPDLAIFDLDIGGHVPFEKVIETANILKQELDRRNIKAFPKTSGGTGMHVYIPLKKIYTFDQVREWTLEVALFLSEKYPNLITTNKQQRKTHSGDKVVLDYLQNAITRNTAAPYTPRANPEAKVSTPLQWEEIERGNFTPSDFTIKTIPERLKNIGNPFEYLFKNPQVLN